MRSKIVSVKDYKEVVLDIPDFQPDQAALQKELNRLLNPYVTWQEGDTVHEGGIVTCSLSSAIPRFQREKIQFVAGSGMFYRPLEDLTLGMRVGETRTLDLPEATVELTVLGVKNRVVPALSDPMVEALGLEGVHTLADYRKYLLKQQLEQAFEEASYSLVNQVAHEVLSETEFILYKEDWKQAVDLELDRCRAIARQDGMVLEQMTPQQFAGNIPVKSYEELVAMTQDSCWDSLRCNLLGQMYAQGDGFAVSKEGYAGAIQEYCNMWNTTEEQAKETLSWETYVYNQWSSHAYHVWREYVSQQYRAKNKV